MAYKRKSIAKQKSKKLFRKTSHHHPRNAVPMTFNMRGGIRA